MKDMVNALCSTEIDLITTFTHSPDLVFLLDAGGRFQWVAPSIEKWGWLPSSESIGKRLQDVFSGETAEQIEGSVRRALEEGSALRTDHNATTPNGGVAWFSANVLPVGGGAVLWMARDITAEKRRERQQQDELALRKAVTAGLADGVCTTDIHGNVTSMNPAAEAMFARMEAEMRGRNVCEVLCAPAPGDTAGETSPCALLRSIAIGTPGTVDDTFFQRADGSPFPVSYSVMPLHLDNELQGAVLVFRDMTGQREFETNLRQAHKMEAIAQLTGGIAHNFNNLLTVINGHTAIMLAKEDTAGSVRRALNEVRHAGERAAQLTHRLLASSRSQILQSRVVDVNAMIAEIKPILRRVVREDIRMEFELEAPFPCVMADPDQLEQVIVNLAVNARDAMPNGGRLCLSTRLEELPAAILAIHKQLQPGHYVKLSVKDTGYGMTAKIKERIFEPYFTTKGPGKGTGLGLAMAYGFIRQIGGHISVDSAVNGGTTISIYLPMVTPETPPADVRTSTQETGRGTETVLLVEDDEAVREFTAEVLRSNGYRVLQARDGSEAIYTAKQFEGRIDLLLADVVMPGGNGPAVAAVLNRARKQMNVLFMSGYPDEAVFNDHAVSRDSSVLAKPFTHSTLLRRVREELDRPKCGGTILIADDDSAIRRLIRSALEPHHYQLIDAKNGNEVLEICKKSSVDLLITDLAMPEKEGLETIRQLHQEFPGVRVVAMSGAFRAEDMLRVAQYLGADSVLTKPLDLEVLPSIVGAALRKSGA